MKKIFVLCFFLFALCSVLIGGDVFSPRDEVGGGKKDIRTACTEMFKDIKEDYYTPLTLYYDLTPLLDPPVYLLDVIELSDNHGMVTTGRCAILTYDQILMCANKYLNSSDQSKRPSISVVQTGEKCSGELSQEFITTSQVEGIRLKNVYFLGTTTASFTVTIKTCETNWSNVRVVWQATTSNPYGEWFLQNKEGEIKANGITFTKTNSDEVAGRMEVDTKAVNKIKIVPNTLGGDLAGKETVDMIRTPKEPVISPDLQQPVYYAGKFDSKLAWDAPDAILNVIK